MTLTPPSPDELFAQNLATAEEADSKVPRDYMDRPMIAPAPGDEHLARKSGDHKGLVPYSRASSFGAKVEDTYYLQKYQQRQVARGFGIMLERAQVSTGPAGGMPRNPFVKPEESGDKSAWDTFVERCHEAAESSAMADLGTAIHYGTECVDKGESLDGLPPLIRERANAYWAARQEWGWRPTSVEVFGVEDRFRVAGTWDRMGWFLGRHGVLDVKTSGSMDFGGLKFAVQLAVYAHAKAYDAVTQTRTPHEVMDLERGWIIHVSREEGGPVELHPVDIARGWRWAALVEQVIEARAEAKKHGIGPALSHDLAPIARCTTRAELAAFMATWEPVDPAVVEFANELWKVLTP